MMFGFVRRLFKSNEELVSEELKRFAEEAGATPIGDCADRQMVEIRGTISRITVNPQTGTPWLEAVLDDGSGHVTLIWMGRRAIAGIGPGRALKVCGRIVEMDERRCMYNPRYELLPS